MGPTLTGVPGAPEVPGTLLSPGPMPQQMEAFFTRLSSPNSNGRNNTTTRGGPYSGATAIPDSLMGIPNCNDAPSQPDPQSFGLQAQSLHRQMESLAFGLGENKEPAPHTIAAPPAPRLTSPPRPISQERNGMAGTVSHTGSPTFEAASLFMMSALSPTNTQSHPNLDTNPTSANPAKKTEGNNTVQLTGSGGDTPSEGPASRMEGRPMGIGMGLEGGLRPPYPTDPHPREERPGLPLVQDTGLAGVGEEPSPQTAVHSHSTSSINPNVNALSRASPSMSEHSSTASTMFTNAHTASPCFSDLPIAGLGSGAPAPPTTRPLGATSPTSPLAENQGRGVTRAPSPNPTPAGPPPLPLSLGGDDPQEIIQQLLQYGQQALEGEREASSNVNNGTNVARGGEARPSDFSDQTVGHPPPSKPAPPCLVPLEEAGSGRSHQQPPTSSTPPPSRRRRRSAGPSTGRNMQAQRNHGSTPINQRGRRSSMSTPISMHPHASTPSSGTEEDTESVVSAASTLDSVYSRTLTKVDIQAHHLADSTLVGGFFQTQKVGIKGSWPKSRRFDPPVGAPPTYMLGNITQEMQDSNRRSTAKGANTAACVLDRGHPDCNVTSRWGVAGASAPGPGAYTPKYTVCSNSNPRARAAPPCSSKGKGSQSGAGARTAIRSGGGTNARRPERTA